MFQKTIKILHFEDNDADAILLGEKLSSVKDIQFSIKRVLKLDDGLQQIASGKVDIILLDLNLPDSSGYDTFESVQQAAGSVPIIIMSGMRDEDLAVQAVQAGAQDYLNKGNLKIDMISRAILYGIERQKLRVKLQQALDQVRTLQGLLPICCHCKDIKDDEGCWHQMEEYIHSHSDAEFTHSICPKCAAKYYPEFYGKGGKKKDSDT